VVEHSLGKGEAESSILSRSTIKLLISLQLAQIRKLPIRQLMAEQRKNKRVRDEQNPCAMFVARSPK
jgi:hypothetical protein